MKLVGVSHPIPTKYAERIYKEGKTVFVGKSYLGKVSPGDKFIIYESWGEKAYTGMGDIKFIGKMKKNEIIMKYKNNLMITSDELKEYVQGKQLVNVIEFENFKKFINPVKPKRFVTVAGKYVYQDEYKHIMEKQR